MWAKIGDGEQYHEIEYQLRFNGTPLGTPETIVIDCNPKVWVSQQCVGATLLSSTRISHEQYLMRTLAGEAVLDGLQ